MQNRKAKTAEQIIDLLVSDRIKETLSPACLRHVLSTEGTGWFAPEKLTEVIDTYENSQMYLPGKYSKFSDTGSAKPGDNFMKQTPSQNVGNSQNSAAYPRWKTGRSSQANGTPSRCWLFNEVGHKACNATKLHIFEFGKPCGLLVDASNIAVGCCLIQLTEGKREKPITSYVYY